MTRRFVITVRQDLVDGTSATFTVDMESDFVRVSEVRVQCGRDGSPLPGALANFDYSAYVSLASALSNGRFPAPEAADKVPQRSNDDSGGSGGLTARKATTQLIPAGVIRRSTAGRRVGAASKTSFPPDFARVYWRLGSIARVAKHYDISRHVAKDWIRELQEQNTTATVGRSDNSSKRGRP